MLLACGSASLRWACAEYVPFSRSCKSLMLPCRLPFCSWLAPIWHLVPDLQGPHGFPCAKGNMGAVRRLLPTLMPTRHSQVMFQNTGHFDRLDEHRAASHDLPLHPQGLGCLCHACVLASSVWGQLQPAGYQLHVQDPQRSAAPPSPSSLQHAYGLGMHNARAHLSWKRSIFWVFRPTLRSCENLHLKPFVHCPALKYSHTMDLGSTPGHSRHSQRPLPARPGSV